MEEKIIFKELSYIVNGCIFDVHNEVGPGVREECYQKAMEYRLWQESVPFLAKPKTRTSMSYREVVVDTFEPDLLVAERMVLELKHQVTGFATENTIQVLNYLKFFDYRLGLLVNFAMDKAIIERIPYQRREADVVEVFDSLTDSLTDRQRAVVRSIYDALCEINDIVGPGYAAATYRNLAIVEFRSRGLQCESRLSVAPAFRDQRLPDSSITPLMVDHEVCLQIEALQDAVSARAVRTMQTHLRLTCCEVGVVACFGKKRLLIRGVLP